MESCAEKQSSEDPQPTTPASVSDEDTYIMHTSISPTIIRAYSGGVEQVIAASVEGAVLELLKITEVRKF